MLKNKRILLIAFAVVFLVALFLIKNTSIFKNEEKYQAVNQIPGLAYNATIGDLVAKDGDGDGVADWEEPLYGLDSTKKETTPGIPDSTAISKLKIEQNNTGGTDGGNQNMENLTETDKFSRELFSTTASLAQSGLLDQTSADQIGGSLAEKIKNSVPEKIFLLSDIKIDSTQSVKNYDNALNAIFEKNIIPDQAAANVLQKFIVDENHVDASALTGFDPIIKSANGIIDGLVKIKVPTSLAPAHLDLLNGWERIMENLSDIKLYDTDPVLALTGISQYENNSVLLMTANNSLNEIINQKINN